MYTCNNLQIYKQTSKKYEVYFNIFSSECGLYSSLSQIYKQTSKKVVQTNG